MYIPIEIWIVSAIKVFAGVTVLWVCCHLLLPCYCELLKDPWTKLLCTQQNLVYETGGLFQQVQVRRFQQSHPHHCYFKC